LNIFYKNIH